MMSTEQVARAVDVASRKRIGSPLRILFSGRLAASKRADALLKGIKIAGDKGTKLELVLIGDGPEQINLRELAAQLGILDRVQFAGALPFEEALLWYDWAHCLVLPSQHSEGWPKVIAEGMCHGLLCIAVAHGQILAMLKDRGVAMKTGTPDEIASTLQSVANGANEFQPMMRCASLWARQYSLEGLRDALAGLLAERWETPLRTEPALVSRIGA